MRRYDAEYARKYHAANREKRNAESRAWREANPQQKLEYERKYKAANRERTREYDRAWYNANKDRRKHPKGYWAKYNRERRSVDLNFRLTNLLRNKVRSTIKKAFKRTSATKLLGCSIPDFKIYLESKFEPGMSWDNYGHGSDKWNIDHIMPCAVFDVTKPEHQRRCFHFSNMQPMWQIENFTKSSKVFTNQFNLL